MDELKATISCMRIAAVGGGDGNALSECAC